MIPVKPHGRTGQKSMTMKDRQADVSYADHFIGLKRNQFRSRMTEICQLRKICGTNGGGKHQ